MTKKLVLVALAAGFAWWHFVGGRKLSEEQVGDFYRSVEKASISRSSERLCSMLDDDFQSAGVANVAGRHTSQPQDKIQACASYEQLYETWDKLGKNMGGMLQLHSDYKIHSVELSGDRKTAKVDISTSMMVGGTLMHIHSRSTDTLVRRNGKVLMLRSEGHGAVQSAAL
jgi:hypothetical protein